MALMGTNLLDSHIEVIKKYNKVVVALDKDATNKALEMSRKISQYVNCNVAFLTDDLKNLKDEDRERFVRKYID
jgi:DNA primase